MPRHPRPRTPWARPHASAFSLMEVLVALGLFALGFAAIAAIFPAGALLQRQTADDIHSRHVARNAESIIYNSPVKDTDLAWYYTNPPSVMDGSTTITLYSGTSSNTTRRELVPFRTDGSAPHLEDLWSLSDRSYPVTMADLHDRDFYWVPLIQDANGNPATPAWKLVVFVMRRHANRTYTPAHYPELITGLPSLRRIDVTNVDGRRFVVSSSDIDELLEINDPIADNAGAVYRVRALGDNWIEVDGYIETVEQLENGVSASSPHYLPDAIWIAPATEADQRSPAMQVFTIDSLPAKWGQPPTP